jgi:hypothetical protein
MRHVLLACVVLAGCERQRDLQLLFGPTANDLTTGFQCRDSNGVRLIRRAVVPGTGKARFQLVIDLLTVGDRLPGCRGEDLVATCSVTGVCALQPPSLERYCQPLEVSESALGSEIEILRQLAAQLHDTPAGRVIDDAPDRPVLVRAVLTTEPCDRVRRVESGSYQRLDPAVALGCAYSCPFVPDTIEGAITLALDALDDQCEANMRVCASFPPR